MTDLDSTPDDESSATLRPRSLPKRLLVATDFSETAGLALDYAIELATVTGGEVLLLHAFEFPMQAFPNAPFGIPVEIGRRLLHDTRMELDKVLESYMGTPTPLRARVEEGDPWRVINDVAEREEVDLVVMGTHGRHGLPHALLGSVAEKVVRTSAVPVLTLRRGTSGETARTIAPVHDRRDE